MTTKELTVYTAAILTTLDEMNSGAPESTFYLLLQTNMDAWTMLKTVLLDMGVIDIKSHYVTLTSKGRTLARKINAAQSN